MNWKVDDACQCVSGKEINDKGFHICNTFKNTDLETFQFKRKNSLSTNTDNDIFLS